MVAGTISMLLAIITSIGLGWLIGKGALKDLKNQISILIDANESLADVIEYDSEDIKGLRDALKSCREEVNSAIKLSRKVVKACTCGTNSMKKGSK